MLLADGFSWAEIRAQLHCSDSYIARWSKRFSAERLAGLYSKHAGRERYKVTDRLEARVLARTTRHMPADGSGQWSSRKLAAELGGAISHTTIARIWSKHGITPQRRAGRQVREQLSLDAKAAGIVGLYLSAPQHAAIFSVDEAAANVAEPGDDLTSRHSQLPDVSDHHGIRALYAALKSRDTDSDEAAPPGRQTSAEFAAFLAAIAANQPANKEIHVIADNLAMGKTRALATLMAGHPSVHVQFTRTFDAWLDQVEKNLAQIGSNLDPPSERRPHDLEQRLMRHIRRWSRRRRQIKWIYQPSRSQPVDGPPRNRNRRR